MPAYKIVVAGPFNAGKTAFIRTVSDIEIVTTERRVTNPEVAAVKEETTVAMDYGRTRLGDVVLHLYGMPGQSRFEFMWDILMREMDGFILMVDSEDRASLMEVKQLLRLYRRGGRVPFVIAANKQDGSAPLPPAEIARLLNLPEAVPVVACVALDPARARPVLETMVQLLTRAKAAA